MNIRELSVESREAVGKGAVGRLRRKGLVPAILYGAGNAPMPLAVVPAEMQRTLHGHGAGGVLVNLRLAGEAERTLAEARAAAERVNRILREVERDELDRRAVRSVGPHGELGGLQRRLDVLLGPGGG